MSNNPHCWAKASAAGYAYAAAKRSGNRRRIRYWNRVLQYWTGLCVGMTHAQARQFDPSLGFPIGMLESS